MAQFCLSTVSEFIQALLDLAVGAFIASNIWATSLHDKVERLNRATDAWRAADKAVNYNEIDLNGNAPADLPGITARLKHRIEDAHQLEDATLKLMQAGMGTLKEDEISITHTKYLHAIEQQSGCPASLDQAAALDKEAAKLLEQMSGVGTLMNSDGLEAKEQSERQETYVKYAGYSLSILGIIVAAIAELTGKSGNG